MCVSGILCAYCQYELAHVWFTFPYYSNLHPYKNKQMRKKYVAPKSQGEKDMKLKGAAKKWWPQGEKYEIKGVMVS